MQEKQEDDFEGIICDNCGHKEATSIENLEHYVGRACPNCGAELLSADDFNEFINAMQGFKLAEQMIENGMLDNMTESEIKEIKELAEMSPAFAKVTDKIDKIDAGKAYELIIKEGVVEDIIEVGKE